MDLLSTGVVASMLRQKVSKKRSREVIMKALHDGVKNGRLPGKMIGRRAYLTYSTGEFWYLLQLGRGKGMKDE